MGELWRQLAALVRRRATDDDVAEELRFHVAMHARDTGDPAVARRRVGPDLLWRERARDAWGWRWLDDVRLDVRYALRTLAKNPGFTGVAVSTLVIGIGINVAVFTVADAVLFKGFRSVRANDRILYIGTQKNGRGCCASYPDYLDWQAEATSFTGMGAVADQQINFSDGSGPPEHYDATRITANGFALLGASPVVGRDFDPGDAKPGATPVAILSSELWDRRYGGDPFVLGRVVRIDGVPTTVVGVMPRGFAFPQNQDLWLPLVPTPEVLTRGRRTLWFAFGRLAPDARFEQARTELATIGQRLQHTYPNTNDGWVPAPRTFTQFFVGVNAPAVYAALWAAVGFVLLIAFANFANLLLARAVGRSREISIRMALGAGRLRIVRQLIVEHLMLAAVAGAVAWWLARWAVAVYETAANPPTRAWSAHLLDFTMDTRVLLYALAVSTGAGLLFGLAPATRLSKIDINERLKDGGRGSTDGGRDLSSLLVRLQAALSIVLLVAAGVMMRSFVHLYAADLGVKPEQVVSALIALPDRSYATPSLRATFFERLERRLTTLPGVESVAIASAAPASGGAQVGYECQGAAATDDQTRPTVTMITIGPEYFRTLGAALIAGRDFREADVDTGLPAAIVNEQFARAAWPGEGAIGKQVRLFNGSSPGAWLTVVGVASDIVQDVTRQRRDPIVYRPFRQQPAANMWVFARTHVPPASLVPAFQRQVQKLDPDLPVWLGPFPLSERLQGTGAYWNTQTEAGLLVVFAAAGLLLAAVGLYAVVAHRVSRRTQEIGVRVAIGATTGDIVGLVVRQGMRPVLIGVGAGLAMSLGVTRALASELVQVSPADPLTYVCSCVVLVSFAAIGCLVPARRAIAVDPVVALRHE